MQFSDLFYKWVPAWLKLLILFILLFVILTANGVFLGNTTDMFSSLGAYPEPYTQAYNALYIGMGLGLMIEIRLKRRFSNKSLLLYGLVMILLMNIVCATTNNPSITVAACLLLGFSKMAALSEVYILWLFIWSKQLDSSRLYPFIYFNALAGLYFMTWLTTKLASGYNWRYAYIAVLILVLSCILLTIIFVKKDPLLKKVPLYQVDWIGLIALGSTMMLVNYIVVYGKVEDWYNSTKIKAASIALFISLLIYIKRTLHIKRPLFNFNLFNKRTFCIGLLYFIALGIFLPSTFQSAFTGGVLHYEASKNAEINLYLIPGVFSGSVLCYFWYLKKWNPLVLIFIGFASFTLYHIIMYNSFSLQFDVHNFWMPSVIKGFAMIVLYIAIGLYTVNKLEFLSVMSAAGMAILVRSFLGSGIFSGLYNYFLYAQRIKHFDYLAGSIDGNDILAQQSSASAMYSSLQQQATLTASKELSGYIIIAGFILLFVILLQIVFEKINKQTIQ